MRTVGQIADIEFLGVRKKGVERGDGFIQNLS